MPKPKNAPKAKPAKTSKKVGIRDLGPKKDKGVKGGGKPLVPAV